MKIFANWCIKNESKRMEAALCSLLPYVDSAVCVDSGSTDGTLEIIEKVRSQYPNLLPTIHVDIGPNKDMSISRNAGLHATPPDTTWYMYPAGDEVYDDSVKNLRPMLEQVPNNIVWVYTWYRHWCLNKDTKQLEQFFPVYNPAHTINGQPACGTPGACRVLPGMNWEGVWNKERLLYPGIGSYFRYTQPIVNNPYIYFNSNLWCDHYGWADCDGNAKNAEYQRLDQLERIGIIPTPRW